jgi:energy-converting hydrogenase Eha subunit A
LYYQGIKIEAITDEMIKLPIILKEQPKRISNSHALLMKFKLKMLFDHFEEWSKELK